MAIVFVSPKQRQKTFFLGITILFLLGLSIFSAMVFFSKPAPAVVGQGFIRPKIVIDFSVLDSETVTKSTTMGRVQKEFSYTATTNKGVKKTGTVFADSIELAQKIVEDMGLVNVFLEEVIIGRENPFTPYYTPTPVVIKK